MSFNPDADVNYQAFLTARNKLNGRDADVFTQLFLQFMGNACTSGSTSNAALVASAIASAKTNLLDAKSVFPADANYLGAIGVLNGFSGNEFNECLEHMIKGHAQLATAVTVLSGASQTTINSNSKTATKAKKITY